MSQMTVLHVSRALGFRVNPTLHGVRLCAVLHIGRLRVVADHPHRADDTSLQMQRER